MNQDLRPLPRFSPGSTLVSQLTAKNLNAPARALDSLRADIQANVRMLPPGTRVAEERIGLITNQGPGGEADFSNAAYWVTFARYSSTSTVTGIDTYVEETRPGLDGVIRANNLSTDSHTLATDKTVVVRLQRVYTPKYPSTSSWVFQVSTTPPVTVRDVTVRLTQNGGSNGNDTTAPSYTYDCYAFAFDGSGNPTNGTQLATAVAPLVLWPKGPAPAATYGQGVTDGTYFKLVYAYEVPDTGVC